MGIIISVILRVILTSFCCKHHHKLWEKQDGPKKNGPNKSKGKRPQINNSPLNNYVTKKWPEENHKTTGKRIKTLFTLLLFLFFKTLDDDSEIFCQVFPVDIWPRSFKIYSAYEIVFKKWPSSSKMCFSALQNLKKVVPLCLQTESRAWDFNQKDNNHDGW